MGVFDEELVEGVGRHVGFGSEDFGCGGGWSNPEGGTVVEAKVRSCISQHGGLPRTRRPQDQLETAIAGYGGDCVLLHWGEASDEVEVPATLRMAVDAVLRPL